MTEPDRTSLPIRRGAFQRLTNRTLDGWQPDWDLIGRPVPPEGAPNVLLVLIDDEFDLHAEAQRGHAARSLSG